MYLAEDGRIVSDNTVVFDFINNEYPLTYWQMRHQPRFSSLGLPAQIRNDALYQFGFSFVYDSYPPNVFANVVEGMPEYNEDGHFYKGWVVTPFTEEEYKQHLDREKFLRITECALNLKYDLDHGVKVVFKGETLIVPVADKDRVFLSVAEEYSQRHPTETIVVPTAEKVITLTAEEFSEFLPLVNDELYKLNKRYWDYVTSVRNTILYENIPPYQNSFLE